MTDCPHTKTRAVYARKPLKDGRAPEPVGDQCLECHTIIPREAHV